MKQAQLEKIVAHGQKLLAIFPNALERDPVALCKKLRRLESAAHAVALRLCNGPEYVGGYNEADHICDGILGRVDKLLGNWTEDVDAETPNRVAIFVNRDPRGYALKIREGAMADLQARGLRLETDWGGYGIIAPEIEE